MASSSSTLESSPRLYQILCIADFSSQDEIKRGYKQMALKYHPDKNLDDPTCVDKFREVRIAYEVLSNPDKKKKYDISLKVHKATTGQYGRAAMNGGARNPASTAVPRGNAFTTGNMNADIYEELHRQQQRRTASRPNQPRTASMGPKHSAGGASSYANHTSSGSGGGGGGAAASSAYTKEQQELFRKRERERQAELKRQLDKERAEAREREREQKRKEQERQEEMLQEQWRRQQAAYAAATAPPRSARRPAAATSTASANAPNGNGGAGCSANYSTAAPSGGGGGSSSAYVNGGSTPRPGTPTPVTPAQQQQQQQQQPGYHFSTPPRNVPDLNFATNIHLSRGGGDAMGARASPSTPRSGTPIGQRGPLGVQRPATTGTPRSQRRGVSAHSNGPATFSSAEGLSFQTLDGSAFMKARTPRANVSPTPSRSTASLTPPAQPLASDNAAPRHSPAFPVDGDKSRGGGGAYATQTHRHLPARRRGTASTDELPRSSGGGGGGAGGSARGHLRGRDASLGRTSTASDLSTPYTGRTTHSTTAPTNAKTTRTAAALHGAKNSQAGQRERQRQRDLRAQEQEQELQRIIRARKQLEKAREEAEDAKRRADPVGYYQRLLDLCGADEASERDQLIEKEEALARKRILRTWGTDMGDLLYGPAIRLLQVQEEDDRADIKEEERADVCLVALGLGELRNRLAVMALERRDRKQLAGKEAGAVYYVQRADKLKAALTSQEATRRRQLEQEAHFKRCYLFDVMGPEFFGRMGLREEERAARRRAVASCFPQGLPSAAATTAASASSLQNSPRTRASLKTGYWTEDTTSLNTTVANLDGSISNIAAAKSYETAAAAAAVTGRGVLPPTVRALAEEEAAHRHALFTSEEAEAILLLRLRANRLRGCHEKEKMAAVTAATRRAARESAEQKKRIAELEAALAAAKAEVAQLRVQRSEGEERGEDGLPRVTSPPMRICTPSSLGDSPRESEGEVKESRRPGTESSATAKKPPPPPPGPPPAPSSSAKATATTTAATSAARVGPSSAKYANYTDRARAAEANSNGNAGGGTKGGGGSSGATMASPAAPATASSPSSGKTPPAGGGSDGVRRPLTVEARSEGGLNLGWYTSRWREGGATTTPDKAPAG